MALIVDPDYLRQGIEVVFDTSSRTIRLLIAGNLSDDGVTLKALYSFCKEQWKNDGTLIKFPFPFTPITDEQFELTDSWNFYDDITRKLVRTGGWAVKPTGTSTEEWAGIVTLGSLGAADQVYYQQVLSGLPSTFKYQGVVNEPVQVYKSGTGGFDYRGVCNLFVREWTKTFASATLNSIGVSTMTYQVYRFPLANASDLKISGTETAIDSETPYTGMTVSYEDTPLIRTIGGNNYQYNIIINGNNATAEQIYNYAQHQLRLAADIDSGTGIVVGKTAADLLQFVGDTLKTKTGVYIDNFQSIDTNRLTFVDISGVERTYPYVANLTLQFGSNLVADPAAKYWVYFTSTSGNNNYGTSNSVLVSTNTSGVYMTGGISGTSSVSLSFAYDSNTQGGRTTGTDAPITAVAIGLSTSQYVRSTGTIARSTSNSVALTSSLERNYNNP